jgi:integrase
MATTSLVGWIDVRYLRRDRMWQARLRWRPDPKGPPKTVETFVHESREEATRLAADAQLEFSHRVRVRLLHPRSRAGETTLAEFIRDVYLPKRLPQLAQSTRETYVPVLRRWVSAYLGGYRLEELDREVGQSWMEWMEAEGASRETQRQALAIARGVLTLARRQGYLDEGRPKPFELVEPTVGPRPVRRGASALSLVEVWRIAQCTPTTTDRAFVLLLGGVGLRQQEAVPLRWRDAINEEGRALARLTVERAVSGTGRNRTIKEPKTAASVRWPQLFAPVGEILEALWREQGEPPPDALIFSARRSRDGLFDVHGWRSKVFAPALAAAGIERESKTYGRVTPHRLRAACASALGYAGWPLADVMRQLGHADSQVLLRHYYRALNDQYAGLRGLSPEEQLEHARAIALAGAAGAAATASAARGASRSRRAAGRTSRRPRGAPTGGG